MDTAIQSTTDMAAMQMTPAPSALATGLRSGADIDKSAKDFEAMFVTQMLQPMFEGISPDPTFGGGNGEEIMRTFLLQEYGKIAAQSGQLGIATAVKNEMIKAQAAAQDPSQARNSNRQKGAAYAPSR